MRVGIDIGGTKTEAVAIEDDGRLAHEVRMPTGFGADAVLETAVAAVDRLAQLAGGAGGFRSIGIGIPGAVDSGSGRVQHAVNLGLEGLDLGPLVQHRVGGATVRVENDVNAAALGAYHLLEDDDMHSMAYLNLGTGLAAGLVLEGRLWRGATGVAGEIGHIPVDPAGPECRCGQRGCLELVASGAAVARQWPVTGGESPVRSLFDAADAGDSRAIEVRRAFATHVADAVKLLVLTVDVDRVVIGGGISSLGDRLLREVCEVLEQRAGRSAFIGMLGLPDRVSIVPPDVPAAAVGAALVGVD